MRQFEPTLFLSTGDKSYGAYSRVCPANISRQPVILTKEEKEKIDKEHPGSYTNAIEYGTNPDKKYWYICPRYWCSSSNTSLTEEEVKNGVCEGRVHEFTDTQGYHTDDKGNYINYNPGFMKKEHHPKGYCIPCCFKNWNSKSQIELRQKCGVDQGTAIKKGKQKDTGFNYYIMGNDKYPIPQNRWGYLPLVVELFLRTDNTLSMDKKNNAQLVEGIPTLLRYGVETSTHQSFVACIADIYGFSRNMNSVSIEEMRMTLSSSISLDNYLKYHNGALVSIFKPKKYQLEEETIVQYNTTEFYKRIDITNDSQRGFLEDTIASFENFKRYLTDKDSLIDHIYLWDFITIPNENLFKNGINLAIIEIVDNDITDNIQFICPTNSYSTTLFDPKKQTVILLKHDKYYEPIYLLTDMSQTDGKIKILKWFDYNSIENIKTVLSLIQTTTSNHCAPMESMPRVYKFKKNIQVVDLYHILDENLQGYKVESQISNYRGKIIGITVVYKDDTFYIPCLPSVSIPSLPIVFTDDVKWVSYEKTRDFLKSLSKSTENRIKSNPMLKVIEDDLIVGILTETNQFIQIDPPIPNDIQDGIPDIKGTNYMVSDKIFAVDKTEDKARVDTTNKIKLETQFFIAFRSTIRILLNNRENRERREDIIEIINNPKMLHRNKIVKLEKILRNMCANVISFGELPENLLNNVTEISSCVNNSTDKCSSKSFCVMKEDSQCSLLLPEKNLLNGKDNQTRYYIRMADELLRYHRVRLFMLDNKNYLNITSLDYHILNNEFIILQTLLMSDYFDDLIPLDMNSYMHAIPYEFANPINAQKYSNHISLTMQEVENENAGLLNPDHNDSLIKERLNKVQGNQVSTWVKMFPVDAKEIIIDASRKGTFYVLIEMLQNRWGRMVTIQECSSLLWEAYSLYMDTARKSTVLNILSQQGKKKKAMIDRVIKNQTTLENLIMSEEYFLTDFDYWMISSSKLNLPIVLFSSTKIQMITNKINWLLMGGELGEVFYFIRTPTEHYRSDVYPSYQYIVPPLKITEVKGLDGMIKNPSYLENTQSLETFLQSQNK